MNYMQGAANRVSERGMSPFGLLFLIIFLIIFLFMIDQGFIMHSQCKEADDVMDCALDILLGSDEEEQAPEGSVTATGVVSGEFKGENHSVTITLNIPLEGGNVTGSFDGDCDGTIKGTYAGGDGGAISGEANGKCAYVFPASGSFSGTVNQASKTVPVRGSGKAVGFSKEGSLTLTY